MEYTYYTCNGCSHATFLLREAIAHFAFYGGHHTFDYNGDMVISRTEFLPLLAMRANHERNLAPHVARFKHAGEIIG